MPSSVRSKDAAGGKAPMSERQQMALLMQMTSTSENLPRSPGGTSYTRHRDRNERGETPLHLAAIKGDIEQVSKLLAHRADPNVPDFAGWTPLHEACNYGWYEIAFKLVQAGANVNAKGLDNDTPLHDAAINGHVQLIKLLVERGADINAKNAKGKTPLDSAHAHVKPYLLDPDLPVSDSMVPSSRLQSRTRDEKKITDSKKSEDLMEANKSPPEDPYEFKTKESSPDQKSTENDQPAPDPLSTNQSADEGPAKRNFSEVSESTEEPSSVDDESKKKKRKDETVKEGKNTKAGPSKGQCNKQTGQGKGATANTTKATSDKKSPCPSPKVTSDAEDDSKSDLKVPPLKIVIPQTTSSETETGGPTRSNKSTQRTHQALPYVVPSSNSSDSSDKDPPLTCAATVEEGPSTSGKSDEKKDGGTTEEQATTENETTTTTVAASPAPSTPAPVVELHPRKRKMKPKEQAPPPAETTDTAEPSVHPHDQPITNCYQMFRDIRKQIEKRRKGLFPVQPKPPQGFKDYLMNRCTYVLAGTTSTTPNISFPPSLQVQMKDLFTDQEKERYRLRMQHVIEKEKLVLSVEQEILRVHGRAARALANQHLPFSVCSILRDEEVYNLITPEQEEKDRNARSRYNGRLFLSWLQDVDDKWEKIKEHMLLRHHNEAESLHAVQKMDWEWKMKELSLCDRKITPTIDDLHVPMVHVSDDFDLLPA